VLCLPDVSPGQTRIISPRMDLFWRSKADFSVTPAFRKRGTSDRLRKTATKDLRRRLSFYDRFIYERFTVERLIL